MIVSDRLPGALLFTGEEGIGKKLFALEVARALNCRIRTPSYLVSAVSSTVRIGTLMPTPSVSVPQITRSSPR